MSEQVSELFYQLTQLADAEGAVPEDGSGIDGIWSTTVPARDRDRDWAIAINADVDDERTIEEFPGEDETTVIPPGRAVIHLGRWPAGVITPTGGQLAVEELDDGPQSIEDELIDDVEARIETFGDDGDPYVCPKCRHEHVDEDPEAESVGPSPDDLRITCVKCGYTDEQVQTRGNAGMEDPRWDVGGDDDV